MPVAAEAGGWSGACGCSGLEQGRSLGWLGAARRGKVRDVWQFPKVVSKRRSAAFRSVHVLPFIPSPPLPALSLELESRRSRMANFKARMGMDALASLIPDDAPPSPVRLWYRP